MLLRTLVYSRRVTVRGDRLWREAVQAEVRAGLAQNRRKRATLTPRRLQRQQMVAEPFVRRVLSCLRAEAPATAPAATLVDENAYAGFRVQRWVLEVLPRWLVGLDLFLPLGPGPYQPVLCPCGHGPKWQADHQITPQVLAQHGFAAALFDMPMFGERHRGNDHFVQGPQSAMTGLWSGFYFLIDILRVADYLQTRPDMDFTRGIGVTGVSGGGMAAMYMPLADPRVRAIVPVCCLAPLGAHVLDGLYTGCQENYLEGMAAAGIDLPHVLGLAAPVPCLVIAGRQDELFRTQTVAAAFREVEAAYALKKADDRLRLYQEDCGHSYTPTMAAQAAAWFRRWLGDLDGPVPNPEVTLLTQADLDCGTAEKTAAMLDLTAARVKQLVTARRRPLTDQALAAVLRLDADAKPMEIETVEPPTPWVPKGFHRYCLHTAGELPLPILAVEAASAPAGTVLAIGDAGTLAVLRQAGGLGGLRRHMLAADIRGYGELAPEAVDYDFYSWCSVDRALGDLLFLLGKTALGQQAGDVLRLLAFAQTQVTARGAEAEPLSIYGRGAAALPVLLGSALFPGVRHIVLDGMLASLAEIATAAAPAWNRYHLPAHVLELFDLPELLAAKMDRRFLVLDPRDAAGQPLSAVAAAELYGHWGPHVTVKLADAKYHMHRVVSEWLPE